MILLKLTNSANKFILFPLAYRSYSYWTVQAKNLIYSIYDDTYTCSFDSHTAGDLLLSVLSLKKHNLRRLNHSVFF